MQRCCGPTTAAGTVDVLAVEFGDTSRLTLLRDELAPEAYQAARAAALSGSTAWWADCAPASIRAHAFSAPSPAAGGALGNRSGAHARLSSAPASTGFAALGHHAPRRLDPNADVAPRRRRPPVPGCARGARTRIAVVPAADAGGAARPDEGVACALAFSVFRRRCVMPALHRPLWLAWRAWARRALDCRLLRRARCSLLVPPAANRCWWSTPNALGVISCARGAAAATLVADRWAPARLAIRRRSGWPATALLLLGTWPSARSASVA